jgi:hypothetical protein
MSLKEAAHDARNRALRTLDPAAPGHAGTAEAVVHHYGQAQAHLSRLKSGDEAPAILRREFVSRLTLPRPHSARGHRGDL